MRQSHEFDNQREFFKVQGYYRCKQCENVFVLLKIEKILQESILNDGTSSDLHESIFMKPEKLHLTFGVMCLTEDENYQQAKQLLVDCLQRTVE